LTKHFRLKTHAFHHIPTNIKYLDIGCHHPVTGNNTYLFSLVGGQGLLVEPNSELHNLISEIRPQDSLFKGGISNTDGTQKYFYSEKSGLNTFSEKRNRNITLTRNEKLSSMDKPILSIPSLLTKYKVKELDVVSIDVEGLEEIVIESFFKQTSIRPKLFCIESNSCDTVNAEKHIIYKYFFKNNYFLYASTGINFIFADKLTFDRC